MRIVRAASLCLSLLLVIAITGCSLTSTAPPSTYTGATITGKVHGGQQPITGAQLYLFAAATTGAGQPSVSLLANVPGSTMLDTSGGATNGDYYATSDTNGNFTITSDYTCTAGQQVYLYALGGNPGLSASNPSVGLLAVLGDCPGPSFSSSTFIVIDEVTTIAAAYALSGFATDALHISSSNTTFALQSISTAFANAANLANLSTGAAQLSLVANSLTYGTAPQATVNTLANILAACVNSSGAVTGPANPTACYTLFNNAKSGSTVPTDTATAAINIAHNPGANITALYGSPTPTGPFTPALTRQPNDFTLGIKFTGGGIDVPENLAVDGHGNVWIVNNLNSISELGPNGAPVSPSTGGFYGIGGYTTGFEEPFDVAIDASNTVWISEPNGTTSSNMQAGILKVNASGSVTGTYFTGSGTRATYLTIDPYSDIWVTSDPGSGTPAIVAFPPGGGTATAFTGGGLSGPYGIASDATGNIWVANNTTGTLSEFKNNGTAYSSSPFAAGGQYSYPHGIAVDSTGNVWVPSYGDTLTIVNQSGANVVSGGTPGEGGLSDPYYTAIDGAGNGWIINQSFAVSEFSPSGSPISTNVGYGSAFLNTNSSTGIAVDGSGDVWIANTDGNDVVELIGASAPALTPIAANIQIIN